MWSVERPKGRLRTGGSQGEAAHWSVPGGGFALKRGEQAGSPPRLLASPPPSLLPASPPRDGVYHAHAVHVLSLSPTGIARIVVFLDPALFAGFGLPLSVGP